MRREEITTAPLLFIDTAGCHLYEAPAEDGDSRYNTVRRRRTSIDAARHRPSSHALMAAPAMWRYHARTYHQGEATVANAHVRQLLQAGVASDAIAVITPYNAQARAEIQAK